ncbi:hypothetical protein LEP1GSC088_2494 [Leptospira interrogans str. L1207]|nr:hypothetical protein LEP1GSC088_2494 [Leptospira interrogans str. L1207]
MCKFLHFETVPIFCYCFLFEKICFFEILVFKIFVFDFIS